MTRRRVLLLVLALLCALPLCAQKQKRQPLNEREIEQIREAGIDPDERIKLYTRFVGEHVGSIEALAKRGRSSARSQRLDDEFQDLAALMDELAANLDQYGERKADLRKSLKALNAAAPRWQASLRGVTAEPGFDLSRKEALESLQDLSEQTMQLEKDQLAYFETHKEEKGQDRAEPKP